ncbi:MAG TPA: hypothetical protein VK436_06440, partial [Methanocella sp.]|nr:hypothetical protein [Methanocella sp.]
MRSNQAILFILFIVIASVSGCLEFGNTPPTTAPTTPTPTPIAQATPTPFVIPGAIGLIPGTQVKVAMKDVTYDTSHGMQVENYTLSLQNTGDTDTANVYFSIKVSNGQTGDRIFSNMVHIGNITAGGIVDQTV